MAERYFVVTNTRMGHPEVHNECSLSELKDVITDCFESNYDPDFNGDGDPVVQVWELTNVKVSHAGVLIENLPKAPAKRKAPAKKRRAPAKRKK